ncbi:class I SAM-dependent methyltransferase [Methanocella conradii]|uniref:class I SAM-dependent methyltransferase n=1 Tax=Methanocella conradii TaxID=1175444 RepID=UPI00157C00B0|nr:class I SAM-dependent methyltransferase [Methanocella conradii]
MDLKEKLVLEVGSGTGLHTGFLVNCGCKHVIGIDLLDYENLWDGNFKKQLISLYNEFGVYFDQARCQFIKMNAENMLFRDNLFDFVISINAFEHISDPRKALAEIYRVLKPGGYAFIQFDPVYYCDTGSHMFDFINEPWGHLIHSEEEYIRMLEDTNTPPAIISDFMHGLNRLPRKYFIELFDEVIKNGKFDKIESYEWSGVTNSSHLEHPNFKYLCNKYPKEDLLFRGMNVLFRKK